MRQRIELLDFWRSLCLLAMIGFHFCYDLMLFGRIPESVMHSLPARLIAWDLGGCFILISGICVRFSRDPLRRGFIVFCAGAAVSAVTTLMGVPVVFGILQMISLCMILYGLLRERIERHIGGRFAAVNLVLFAATWFLTSRRTVDIKFLYPFGLRPADFFSADYWPVFPWIFLFLIGMFFGK